MAEKAVELIVSRLEDPQREPQDHTAPFELRVRESTR
jgi:DNA-binding LacI/PurR family transcriptional regulator